MVMVNVNISQLSQSL